MSAPYLFRTQCFPTTSLASLAKTLEATPCLKGQHPRWIGGIILPLNEKENIITNHPTGLHRKISRQSKEN